MSLPNVYALNSDGQAILDPQETVRRDIPAAALADLTEKVGEALADQQQELSAEDRTQFVTSAAERIVRAWVTNTANNNGAVLSERFISALVEVVIDEVVGTAQLGPYLRQRSQFSDLHFNGTESAWGRVRGTGQRQPLPSPFRNDSELVDLIKKLIRAYATGEPRFDPGSPAVDIELPGGERVHAIRTLTTPTCVVAIRIPDLSITRFQDLIDHKTISCEMAHFLKAVVDARLNIVVGGGTGSGKTTLLRVLLNEVEPTERIVTIEDLKELRLGSFPALNRNTWAAETVKPNVDGQGEITAAYLMKEALRQDPDRIVIGEVRGDEALEMFKAMSTGNDGSMCSIHARSATSIMPRLIQCIPSKEPRQVCIDVANSVDLFVHLEKTDNGPRISAILEVDDHLPEVDGIVHTSVLWGKSDTCGLQYHADGMSPQLARRLNKAGWSGRVQ